MWTSSAKIAIAIIDVSVTFKWIVREPDTPAALRLIGREKMSAPLLLLSEVADAVRNPVRRGELTILDPLARSIDDLANVVVLRDERDDVPVALSLAGELNQSVYDCIYLATAMRVEEPLCTADARFVRKLLASKYRERVEVLQW